MLVPKRSALLLAALPLLLASAPRSAQLGPVGQEDDAADDTPEEGAAAASWLVFPDDPLGRPWASVASTTAPWDYLTSPASEAPDAEGEPWVTWAADVGTVGSGDDTPGRRKALARLCRFAARDGRADDAYRWAAALGAGDPEGLAGVVPYLFPGLPFGTPLEAGGRPGVLPPSITLRPLLPPATKRLPFGQIQWREARANGLKVGGVSFDLMVKVDGSGVVAEFMELKGERTTIDIVLPAPAGYRLKSLYIDWDKVPLPEDADPETIDWSTEAVRVTLDPESENYSVFARLAPVKPELPTPPAAGLPATLLEAGLTLRAAEDAPPELEHIAAAWGAAVGVEARVERGAAKSAGPGIRGAVIDLERSAAPERLIRAVTSAIESRVRPGKQR